MQKTPCTFRSLRKFVNPGELKKDKYVGCV